MIEAIATALVTIIVLAAWFYIAHQVWTHQEDEREHSREDILWEPRQGRKEP